MDVFFLTVNLFLYFLKKVYSQDLTILGLWKEHCVFILGEVDKKIKILMGLVPIGPLDLFHHIFIDLFMYSFVYSINTC